MSRAAELLRLLLDAVEHDFPAETADLYVENAQISAPFASDDTSLTIGRATIRERFASGHGRPFRISVRDIRIHDTDDPHLAIGEFTYDWTVNATGRTFSTKNIQVVLEREGLIAETRDYHDHSRIAEGLRSGSDQ